MTRPVRQKSSSAQATGGPSPARMGERTGLVKLMCACTLIVTGWGIPSGVAAREPSHMPPAIREVQVPVDELATRLNDGDWQPVERDKYQRLLDAARPVPSAPPTTWIERAEYSATFVDDAFRSGKWTADVKHTRQEDELLPLDPLNLAVSALEWPDAEAVWGTTREGWTALLVERDGGRLTGRWNLKGRRLARTVEFDVQVAPATTSQLVLTLPQGRVLESSVGDVRGPTPAEKSGWAVWQVDLGSRTDCRLTVSRAPERGGLQPLLLTESDISYVIRQEGLRFQAEFNLQVLNVPVDSLTFVLPAELEIYSITYGGEAELSWKPVKAGSKQWITAELPDALIGRSRPLRLQGLAPSRPGRSWTLPRPMLENGTFMTGQLNIRVDAPLELQSFDTAGYRQIATVAKAGEGETLTFHQFLPDAGMTVELDHPQPKIFAQGVTHLSVSPENWSQTSEFHWQARSGATFRARCLVARGWEVTDVRSRSNSSGSRIINWEVTRQDEGRDLLHLEFLESLRPGSPKVIEVQARRLPVPSEQQQADLPVLQPLDCESAELLLAVSHPSAVLAIVEPSSTFEPVPETDLPDFTGRSPLWERIQTRTGDEMSLLFSSGPSSAGRVRFENVEPPLDARVRVGLELESDQINENFTIHVVPQSDPVDRLLVYLTAAAEGPPPVWELVADRPLRLESQLISPERHGDWNLPPDGELWEVSLQWPQKDPFRITAGRSRPLSTSERPPLAFVPGAREFEGTVELRADEDAHVEVRSQGLQPREAETNEIERPAPDPRPPQSRSVWQYRTAADELELQLHKEAAVPRAPPPASLKLQSLIHTAGDGYDIHWASFKVDPGASPVPFQFELSDPAVLVTARLNGQTVRPLRDGSAFVLPPLVENRLNVVEIQYRCPSAGGLIQASRNIVVPRSSHTVLDFDWEFALPSDARLIDEPKSLVVHEPLPQPSWRERFFGPLGRAAHASLFNPLEWGAWQSLFATDAGDPPAADSATAESFAPPAGWIAMRATAPRLPDKLRLEIWHHSRGRLLAWVGLLGCLLVGLLLRAYHVRLRGHAAASWLSLCVLVAALAPAMYAEIGGGCLAGTLLAVLLPRNWLRRFRPRREPEDDVPVGSTASFRHVPASCLLICIGLLATPGPAQESPPAEVRSDELEAAIASDGLPEEGTVLVPIGPDQKPSREIPVVYMHEDLLARLQQQAGSGSRTSSDYLISSVEYGGRVDSQKAVTLDARYTVAVLSSAPLVRVFLPVTGANLGGPEACRVNGQSHPVLRSRDEEGFVVELNVPEQLSSDGKVPLFDVELRLHPPTTSVSGGGSFSIGVPPVAASRLTLELSEPFPTIDVSGARGEVVRAINDRIVTTRLGRADRFDVTWSANSEPVQPPPSLEANVFSLVEAQPTWLQFQYRVVYRVLEGSVDFVEWQLPAGMIVRDVTADQLLSTWKSPPQNGSSRLLIEFSRPQVEDFVVDATFTLPIQAAKDEVVIPALDLFGGDLATEAMNLTLNQVGVSSRSEFRLTPLTSENETVRELSADSFVRNLAGAPNFKRPQYAYQLQAPTDLSFGLVPLSPQRTVRMKQEGRVGRRKLDWTVSAEVATATAPAFQHSLRVDPRLKIETVSVIEDEAPRLTRWSRSGDRLDLFLSDKTTGTQEIVFKGSLPLSADEETRLPAIRFLDAEIGESNLRLFHDVGRIVELVDDESLVPLEEDRDAPSENGRTVFLGQFSLLDASDLPGIRPVNHPQQGRADAVTVAERRSGSRWNLSTTLKFSDYRRSPTRFRVRIPSELAPIYRIEAPGDEVERWKETRPDGSIDVTFAPKRPTPEVFSLTVNATLRAPRSEEWLLPTVSAIDATHHESYLLLPLPEVVRPVEESFVDVQTDELPDWVTHAALSSNSQEAWQAYRSEFRAKKTIRVQGVASSQSAHIPLAHTHVWLEQEGSEFGCTEFFLVSTGRRRLDLTWPEGMTLRAVFVNGTAIQPQADEANRLFVPLDATAVTQAVVVHWSRHREPAALRWGEFARQFPHPTEMPVERSLLTLVPPRGLFFVRRNDPADIDPLIHALERLEGLLDACRSHVEIDDTLPAMWPALLRLQESLNNRFDIEGDPAETPAEVDYQREALLDRFLDLSDEIESLWPLIDWSAAHAAGEDSAPAIIDLPGRYDATGGLLSHRAIFSRLPPEERLPAFSFWGIDGPIMIWSLGLLAFLAVTPLACRFVKLETGEWLDAHRPVAWGLLGLVWWTCLTASLFGFLLLLAAGFAAVRRHSRIGRKQEALA